MDKQDVSLWGIIIICCLVVVAFPYIYTFVSPSVWVLGLLILLVPVFYWHLVLKKIPYGESGEKNEAKINKSSVILGFFCGIVASGYAIFMFWMERVAIMLDKVSSTLGKGSVETIQSSLSMLDISRAMPLLVYSIFVLLFLLEVVAVITIYLGKKKGFSLSETKESLKKNLLIALATFIVIFVLTWFFGVYFVQTFL